MKEQASMVRDKAQRLAKALRATAGVLAVLALSGCEPEAAFERAVERWEDRAAHMVDGDEKGRARVAAYRAAAARTGYVP